jgi:hypothetical protein
MSKNGWFEPTIEKQNIKGVKLIYHFTDAPSHGGYEQYGDYNHP